MRLRSFGSIFYGSLYMSSTQTVYAQLRSIEASWNLKTSPSLILSEVCIEIFVIGTFAGDIVLLD